MPVSTPAATRLREWIGHNAAILCWMAAAVTLTLVTIKSAPEGYRQSAAMMDFSVDERAEMIARLESLHLSPTNLAQFESVTKVVSVAVTLSIGWLLIRSRSRSGFVTYLAFWAVASGQAMFPPSIPDYLPGQPVAQTIARLATTLAIGGLLSLPLVFPDGRFVPRWTILPAAYAFYGVGSFAFDVNIDPVPRGGGIPEAVLTVGLIGAIIYSVVYRYRRVSNPLQRQQTRLASFGLVIGVFGFFLGDAFMRNIDSTVFGVVSLIGFLLLMPILTTMPLITIAIAVLKHNLFDMDVVISKTIIGVVMTMAITGTYIGIVVGIGSLLATESNLLLSLLATVLVAVGFQPLRQQVQRFTNRVLFGDRDDPYVVLSRVGQQIGGSTSAGELLPHIVRSTAEALRLPYVALLLERSGEQVMVASTGASLGPNLRMPVTYQGQMIGSLEVSPRSRGEVFSTEDRRLLEDLARQFGVAAHSVGLAEDLQRSREQIVASREEERRRLRREIHDGLGAQLAALIMQAGSAKTKLQTDPELADQELESLRGELRAAVTEVRRLVQGLRPPALDELGLIGALEARLSHFDRSGLDDDAPPLRIVFENGDDLRGLSAATEVAAYRIVDEAITNIVRHAGATEARVAIHLRGDTLAIDVTDDGIGIKEEEISSNGIGLQTMRERALELGGRCRIVSNAPGNGTTVSVLLPLHPMLYETA